MDEYYKPNRKQFVTDMSWMFIVSAVIFFVGFCFGRITA